MDRRTILRGGAALAAAGLAGGTLSGGPAFAGGHHLPPVSTETTPFDRQWLLDAARRLARQPFRRPEQNLSDALTYVGYDAYLQLRYRPQARLWDQEELPFALEFFHPGYLFKEPVRVFSVTDGAAREIGFTPELYRYPKGLEPPAEGDGLGFSGFRALAAINTPHKLDEFVVFQGASYFRAVARGQQYGLSARGIFISSHVEEEFPLFTHFWVERPAPTDDRLIAHALLDGPSVTGAYRFAIRPGHETAIDVEATLFSRKALPKLGVAPLTSMYLRDPLSARTDIRDYRPAVHDSNGLQMQTASGEWLWRPLANPSRLQVSAFADTMPRGFGLMQRPREFADYQDPYAHYHRRPSLWIEPLGDWPEGFVELVEHPTTTEYHDNIVAYWTPAEMPPLGEGWSFAYRMRWAADVAPDPALLRVAASRIGRSGDQRRILFSLDFSGPAPVDALRLAVTSSAGRVVAPNLYGRLPNDMLRVYFELDPGEATLADLRLRLLRGREPASETWLYRWTA